MRLAAFPPQAPFLPALARAWLAAGGPAADGLLLLESRRAARALAAAFLEAHGAPLVLPRIVAIGAIDEPGLILAAGLALPQAIAPLDRLAALARLVGARHPELRIGAVLALARELARLMDEADRAEIDLARVLPGLVEGDLARHWQQTLEFLRIVTETWPAHLAEAGLVNPAARAARLAHAQGEAWRRAAPEGRLWFVSAGGAPATLALAETVARAPRGLVIIPGFDPHLPEEGWAEAAADPCHPQYGPAALLAHLGARVADVALIGAAGVAEDRARFLSRALLPSRALAAWREGAVAQTPDLYRLAPRDEAEEALAIALALRDTLQTPGRTAALITPDRALAARVGAALRRFGIEAEDSAGDRLADTPPAAFLRLLAAAGAERLAPVPFASLMQHPLFTGGKAPGVARLHGRAIELAALRGPRPEPGLRGIEFALAGARHQAARDFFASLGPALAPLLATGAAAPAALLSALIEAAEALAATDTEPGADRLWASEAGAALADLLAEAVPALEPLPPIPPDQLPELLDALLEGVAVRRPRAKDAHPRIAIWGLREARLQHVDVAVLGAMVEGVWPEPADPGPWLSRPMRAAAGLPSPEAAIGEAAREMAALAAACGTVIFSAPSRRGRAPAVPARWLQRIDALLGGEGRALAAHPAVGWARTLDRPEAGRLIRRPPPAPRPPATARPAKISITDVTTLLGDPFAYYCRRILRLSPLAPLDEETDAAVFGEIVHEGIAKAASLAAQDLEAALTIALRARRPRAALAAWWAARLSRIAAWVATVEAGRPRLSRHAEVAGEIALGGFTLHGRADRIERLEGGALSILDFKTGTPPEQKAVTAGLAPQLPLEALIAERGGFAGIPPGTVTALIYWKLSGGFTEGKESPLFEGNAAALRAAIDAAAAHLPPLLARFADPAMPYLARPHPARAPKYDDYAGISRLAESGAEEAP